MPRASFFPLYDESDKPGHTSPFSKALSDITEFISENIGFDLCRQTSGTFAQDEPVSPSSLPRRSALTTRKPRLALDTVEVEGAIVKRTNGHGKRMAWDAIGVPKSLRRVVS